MRIYLTNYKNDRKKIKDYYSQLVKLTKNHHYIGVTNEWIIDNYYMLVEQEKNIKNFFSSRSEYNYAFKKFDLYKVIKKVLKQYNYRLDLKVLVNCLNTYQDNYNCYFSYQTISTISKIVYLILINELASICEREKSRLLESQDAIILLNKIKNNQVSIETEFDDIPNRPFYLETLYSGLKEQGDLSNDIFEKLVTLLNSNNINLNKTFEQVYEDSAKDSVIVSNIFYTISVINKVKAEKLYDSISKIEKILSMDECYNSMTRESKQLYRKQVFLNSKKTHLSEYEYVKQTLNIALKENKHIGFLLFKKSNLKIRRFFYLTYILIITLMISILISPYLFEPVWLSTLLLLIPTSEIVIQLTNKILLRFYKPRPLFKLDYSEGIPKDDSSMVVIVTIINNKEKVHKMFETLEKYYLANKSDNLYFTLLGDCSSSNKPNMPYDKEIIEALDDCSNRLNKKYGNIFNYIYRKRIFSKSENCYLGWERKRGALQNLNQLLLNKLSKDEQERLFQKTSLTNFKTKIKYVITLDTDTKLVLKAALNLVGAMAHPLNKPVLDKNNQVTEGYGIMQPKIAIDIESSNKTAYTQVYAGIGGFDVYNSVVPNFYQDVFNEGSFIGKGIYDLKIFDQVLTNRFPNDLILSHDLLEGNYIRCGFLSDVEVIDDFPSGFLIDASRRHRWARGDMQIISWGFNKHLNSIERFKILDNIRRGLLDLSLLLIIIFAYIIGKVNPFYWIMFVCITLALPIIYYVLDNLKFQKERSTKTRQYENIVIGLNSIVIRALSSFSSIPYNAKLYLDAFTRAIYRMTISKKNLLNWITAEEAEKTVKKNLSNYIKQFSVNYLVSFFLVIMILLFKPIYIISGLLIALIFMISPIIFYMIGKENRNGKSTLNETETKEMIYLAKQTWGYFNDLLTQDNNYLIPDNFQLNRDIKSDYKTSPTDISFSIIAIISANELGFINTSKSVNLIEKIISSVESLEKWNGHLYNWYNIKTKNILNPHYISTVDSGNFVASLITLTGYLKNKDVNLYNRVQKIINETNFSKLYKEEQNAFSCGYDTISEQLSYYNYNKFASESRLTSFIAIAKGDILPKHWFLLDKTLTKFHDYKGLLSWSGTSFEYFMPLIYMKDYPNTLIDESYYFAYYCQKKYMEDINEHLPWGISESAYNVLDDSKNYKYQAFGTPYLRFQDNINERIVISPYASMLILPKQPKDVYNNYLKLKNIGMQGKYGLYESYDVEDKKQVLSYYAHHQGMIIASLTNYLKSGAIQNYFYDDVNVKAFDVLNKEKMQIKPMIDSKVNRYKKYNYEKQVIPNDIRSYNYIKERPEISVLSNSRYTILINDRGNGFSRYKNIQLNRYRKISENDYGMYLYIKDLDDGKIWSNTYAPTNIKPERYEVTFALDEIKFIRHDNNIITTTQVIVSKEYNAEIRKITLKNIGDTTRKIELTSYFEPTIAENADDISHRVFNNLFIKSSFDKETNALLLERKMRNSKDKSYLIHKLFITDKIDNYSYETERTNFLNRNDKYSMPSALNRELTNYVGDNIEPIASMRNLLTIEPQTEEVCYIINGFGKSKEQVINIINSYNNELAIDDAFRLSSIMTNKNISHQGLNINEVNLYNKALNYLYQTSKIHLSNERKKLLLDNNLSQKNLWRFGVSGDRPIILVEILDITGLGIAREILKMFEYYKTIGMYVDIVLINSNNVEYAKVISDFIKEKINHIYSLNNFSSTPGSITIIEKNNISIDELNLFRSIARLKFDTYNSSSLSDSIENLQINNTSIDYNLSKELISNMIDTEKVQFDNTYGGFINNGTEYLIKDLNTPLPWSNVLCNEHFGTVITNNDNGFTYAYNSREFKLTSWTNDVILNDKSEGFRLNNKLVNWGTCIHGFGYSSFDFTNDDIKMKATYFVPTDINVKIAIVEITNLNDGKLKYNMDYWLNPVLGTTEEKTARHIVDNFDKNNNVFTLENRYVDIYKGTKVYLSSSEPIEKTISEAVIRGITINVELEPKENKIITFMLGCENSQDDVEKIVSELTISNIKKHYRNTVQFWKNRLTVFNIKTPDDSFNYMMNGWLLYQTIASRIVAKTGFYQVGGAFGFRDQLQDCTNICMIEPELTKKQILNCAKHQFKEGDVLHWWHPQNQFGLRSKFKDDYLWLVYATSEYIRITGDLDILKEKVSFVDGQLLNSNEEERGMDFVYTDNVDTLFNHLQLAIDKCFKEIGDNGLPLMGGGDWNDGMNHIGIKGKGTSVWLGFFIYDIVNRFTHILRKVDSDVSLERYVKFNNRLKSNLLKAWDGKYYLRAINDDEIKIGSMTSKECEIDLISQSFAILTDIASKEQTNSIIESVQNKLVDTKNGLIKLLTPPFTDEWIDPGYIKNYPKGVRENGGQYTHACSWYIMALEHISETDKAYEYFSMINPINHSKTRLEMEKYKVEPYVIAADIYSNTNFIGHGGWTWYTGSSGWFYKVGIESILGINKIGNSLNIKTNIPSKWDNVKVTYRYIDTTYHITILNDSKNEITLDGKIVKENIDLVNDLEKHEIIVKRCIND